MLLRPPCPTLFPYTTLFRSVAGVDEEPRLAVGDRFGNAGDPGGDDRHSPSHRLEQRRREPVAIRSEEHTSELQSPYDLVCRLLLEKKKTRYTITTSITNISQ